nr:hypothetical protein [Tanacetum cinerariifolium]
MANTTVGFGMGSPVRPQPVPTSKPKVTPVSTGKPQVSTPVPTGRKNRPFPVPTDRGYSSSVISGIYGQLLLSPQQVVLGKHIDKETSFSATKDEGIFNGGCSRSRTGNKERLDGFQAFHGGKVTFRGGEGRTTGKGTIHTECLVLSKDFKLPNDSMVVLKVPRKHNLYTINLNDLCPRGNLACLVAHASFDESMKWHRRMAHVNYKNMNRLVKENLVRGLPPKLFKNGHTCVACCKGKQHKASYKAISDVSSIFKPLQLLHMDLFGPTSIRSIDHKYYCLVITNDYSRFCWVFLEHKDETYPILKNFINLVENQLNKMVKAIRCDNGTEFKNARMIELYGSKGIKREYRIRTACYVLNRVSVTSPHNKTPYALLTGHIPSVSHFKPFRCHITILNASDHLGKFDGKADEGYIVGYSASNKAYKVYNVPNKRVEKSMNLCPALGTANNAEDLQTPPSAQPVPPGCILVPTGNVPVPTGSLPVPTGSIPVPAAATMVPSDDVPVHSSSSTDSIFDVSLQQDSLIHLILEIIIPLLVFSLLHHMMMSLILLSTMSHPLW